jgi:hypothetical protein
VNLRASLLLLVASTLLVVGVGMWSVPAGLVVAGLLLFALGVGQLDVSERT